MKIRYLLMNAYGVGGTIRTVINQSNALAGDHQVEIVSVFRRRDRPAFHIDPRIRLTPLIDERTPAPDPAWWPLIRRRDKRRPGAFIPRDEARAGIFTRPVERRIIDYLRSLHDGVLVSTRPALNLLTARFTAPGVVRIGQDHMNLRSYKPGVSAQIRRWYPRLDAVTVLTRADESDYRDALAGSGVRIQHIPNPLPSLDRAPAALDRPVVVAAGRLVRQKGFDRLIDAFAIVAADHPDWQLRIYGAGKQEDLLRQQVRDRHLHGSVQLMGQSHQLEQDLAKASIYVLSSRFEGFPMVLLEAMCQGLAVIAVDCHTGPAEIITHDQNGLLVPQDDTTALARAITQLITDEPRRRRLGAHATRTIAHHAMNRILPQWEQLFTELLDTKQPRSGTE